MAISEVVVTTQKLGGEKVAQDTVHTFVIVHPYRIQRDLACLPVALERAASETSPVGSLDVFHVGILARHSLMNIHKVDVVVLALMSFLLCHELQEPP